MDLEQKEQAQNLRAHQRPGQARTSKKTTAIRSLNSSPAAIEYQTSKALSLIEGGKLGTAIILQLVEDSEVRPTDLSTMGAIEKSIFHNMAHYGVLDPNVYHVALAAVLAAYELGRLNIFGDENHKTAEEKK